MSGWTDWVERQLKGLDVDITIGSGDTKIRATTSGTTGRPSVTGDFGERGGFRYGDLMYSPTVLLVGAIIVLIIVLRSL